MTIINFKNTIKQSAKRSIKLRFKHDKLKQQILIAGNPNSDLLATSKAKRYIKTYMIFHNFLFIMGQIILSIIVLYLAYLPFMNTSNYVHAALNIPYQKITNGQVQEIILTGQGHYMIDAGIFTVAVLFVWKRPWTKAPYHHITVNDFIKKEYPDIKKEAAKLNH